MEGSHKQYREKLVETVREKGISDEAVLKALLKVPRHLFMPESYSLEEVYTDTPQPIGYGQTISQPYTVAFQTQLLNVEANDKILEIGTGSGYQASILVELGAHVFSIERQQALFSVSKIKLTELGYGQIHLFYGDGMAGLAPYAPFDKIIVTAAASEIPQTLIKQLRIGGIMVVPVNNQVQKMLRITRISETNYTVEEFGDFKFVPLLPGIAEIH